MTNSLPSIGLIGRKQVGKSTIGGYLADSYTYETRGFADPLREMARAINPIIHTGPSATYGELLDSPLQVGTYELRLLQAEDIFGYDRAKELFPEFRRFLQTLGTEAGRQVLGKTIWVDAFIKAIMPLLADELPIVVTDVRFPNEADALRDLGFKLVRVIRPGRDEFDVHPSETSMDDYDADVTIRNDSTSFGPLFDSIDTLIEVHQGEIRDAA